MLALKASGFVYAITVTQMLICMVCSPPVRQLKEVKFLLIASELVYHKVVKFTIILRHTTKSKS